MKTNWNQARFTEQGRTHGLWRFRAQGHGKPQAPQKFTGYHKLMPKSERTALAMRLQREAASK